MKVLLDEMYTGLKEYLQTLGWDVLTVENAGLKGANDKRIVDYVAQNSLLLVTADEKNADLAKLRNVPHLLISRIMLAKMIDEELRKIPQLKKEEAS